MNIGSSSPSTDFAIDIMGRYVCNTFDEVMASSDPGFRATATDVKGNPLPPRGDVRPFDFIIIGGGTFGGAVAEHLLFRSTGRTERILVLEAGPFALPEHIQNVPSITDVGEVWGLPWNGNIGFKGLAFCVGGALHLLGRLVATAARFRDSSLAESGARRSERNDADEKWR